LKLQKILEIAGNFSWQQLSERDMFRDRAKKGEDINMREFLYPLLQGYDSVAMNVDVEIGGTDQMFNMLAGRTLVDRMLHKEKFVLTTPLLTDSEGRKIGKTEGNVIALNDKPEELFGKIMSLSDDVIVKGLEYLTDVPMEEVDAIRKDLEQGGHPVAHKKKLAYEIVKQLNNEEAAKNAQEYFEKTVQKKEMPEEIPVYQYTGKGLVQIVELLVEIGLAASRSEAKRLIEQGGVEIDNEKVVDANSETALKDGIIVKVGKRKFVKVQLGE
jgi:tyrosyl-tRNA synthetase